MTHHHAHSKIDAQRLRNGATQAMSEATRLADEGRLDLARSALKEASMLAAAASERQGNNKDPSLSQLVSDLEYVEAGYADEAAYDQFGRKRTTAHLSQERQQRCEGGLGSMREQRGRAAGGNTSSMQSLLSSSQHDGQPGGAQQTLPPEDGYVAGYMSAFNRSRKPLGGGGGGAAPLPPLPSRAGPPQMPYAPRSAARVLPSRRDAWRQAGEHQS